jgi:hypothetical protein
MKIEGKEKYFVEVSEVFQFWKMDPELDITSAWEMIRNKNFRQKAYVVIS